MPVPLQVKHSGSLVLRDKTLQAAAAMYQVTDSTGVESGPP